MQTDLQTDPLASLAAQQSSATDQGNTAIMRTVRLTEPSGQVAVPEPAVTEDEPETVTHADTVTAQPAATALTTLELSFCDATGRTLGFRDAVARNAAGDCSLRPNARPVFRGQERDPRCLGGVPGRWPRYYAGRSPTQFGFDADLAVMYWDQRERRGKAASAKVLQDILGDDWKDKLRQIRDERLRPPNG